MNWNNDVWLGWVGWSAGEEPIIIFFMLDSGLLIHNQGALIATMSSRRRLMGIRTRHWSALALPVNGTTLLELLNGVRAVQADIGESVHISSSSTRTQGDAKRET